MLNASKITIVHKNTVSIAKDLVGNKIREKIREIGKLWNENQNKRIFPEPAYSDWQKLIEFWRDCPDLPLIIRKNKEHRGERFSGGLFGSYVAKGTMDKWLAKLQELDV